MDSDERLTTLKKAYADIILNTAKEAAARIIVSERKALRYHHELNVAKEEALQMLLRLKRMMDAKISDAETTSLSQQRKIEELEAQLQEAEDIVRDLRDELREAQDELQGVKINEARQWNECGDGSLQETSEDQRPYASQSIIFQSSGSQHESFAATDMRTSGSNQMSKVVKCHSSTFHIRNSYIGYPDVPSIILRTKEPQLYRNGCTQRIRAGERNLLDKEVSLNGQLNDVKNESIIKAAEEGDKSSKGATHEVCNMSNLEKKVAIRLDRKCCRWGHIKARLKKRKAASGYEKNRTSSSRYLPDRLMKTNQSPDIPCLRSYPNRVDISSHSGEDPSNMAPRSSLAMTEEGTQPKCEETTESELDFSNASGTQNAIDKEALVNVVVPANQESESMENVTVPSCRMPLAKDDFPLLDSKSKVSDTTNEIVCQPVNDRIIKYTFQRKRKRGPLSSPESGTSLERSTLKRKMGDKQNGGLQPQKSSLITESSRDGRRLAQVARQLMSLSGKKWWH